MKMPTVEPDADAEAIFWEVRVDDSSTDELALKNYVRVKIFTERGREEFSKRDIPFIKGTKIKDVDARVTKPDGSVVYLKKEDILERDIVKANGIKIKAKSFALPGIEIGSIVEFRYREVIENGEANMRLIFQRDIPIENVSYYVRPFSGNRAMLYQSFNAGNTKFEKDKDGFSRATMTNVPAFHEEPNMLPEDEVRSWMYIYYSSNPTTNAEAYWKEISKFVYDGSKNSLKPNDDIKRAAAEITNGASSDEEKLKKIYDYCKTEIKNIAYTPNVSDDDRKKVRDSKTASDTLKLKMGSGGDIDALFGALAKASGFDARLALSGDRSEMFFNPRIPNVRLMLNSSSIAVKVGNSWQIFSPANYYMPFGMLAWNEEAQTALVTDSKDLIWVQTPLSSAEKSMERRSGKFKLTEDGTLTGEARIEFTGHRAAMHKNYNNGDSPEVREATLKNLIKSNIGAAQVNDFTIENVTDPEKPFIYTFKIRVPNYASRTGKRLFFQPDVFDRNASPQFSASARKYDVYINYPWAEEDNITIELPDGFSLESPDAPAPIKDPQGIGSHETKILISKDGKILTYNRKFSFGNGGAIRFPVESYPAVKQLFDAFDKADKHQLTLRQGTSAAKTN
ncbi:MAG: DUF3857 domain-containing transglutaminase family protein [Pyrinomonadaceae bacterium]